jgi:RNA polymerase sigma-70 factor (ECF subfamily)
MQPWRARDEAGPPAHADAELVARVATGDAEALREAYERHGAIVFGAAMRLLGDHQLAEECTQDVFLTLWREAGRFDAGRGTRLSTWLYAIARNRAIALDRRRRARPATPVAEAPVADTAPDPAELVLRADEQQRVAEALGELPDEQLEVVRLAYFDGLTQDAIASRLGVPLGTVKGRARLALDRLRRALGPGGGR